MTPKSLQILFFIAVFATSFSFAEEQTGSDKQADEAEKYLLRFQWREGEQLRYETTHRTAQVAVAPAGSKSDKSSVEQKRVFHVTSVDDDGNAKVAMQFERVRMERQIDDQPAEVFDTKMKAEEIPTFFQATANKLKGKAPKFTVRTSGTPVKDDGYVDLPADGEPCFMLPLPQEKVAVGDTWKVYMTARVRVSKEITRKVKLLRTLKLESVKDDVATITTAVSVAARVRTPGEKAQLVQATPQGSIRFDMRRGRMISKKLTFDRSVLGAMGKNTILNSSGEIVETIVEDAKEAVTIR